MQHLAGYLFIKVYFNSNFFALKFRRYVTDLLAGYAVTISLKQRHTPKLLSPPDNAWCHCPLPLSFCIKETLVLSKVVSNQAAVCACIK